MGNFFVFFFKFTASKRLFIDSRRDGGRKIFKSQSNTANETLTNLLYFDNAKKYAICQINHNEKKFVLNVFFDHEQRLARKNLQLSPI